MPSARRMRLLDVQDRLDFLITPGNYPAGFTATRADSTTVATRRDQDGNYYAVPANRLRDDHWSYNALTGLWDRTILREGAATNDLTYGRVLSNGAWAATNATVDAVAGITGVAASASRLTATAANATVIRAGALVHASAARAGSAFFRRVTGTGNVDITLDNGATWTTVTLTSVFTQLWKTQTLANSQFGIRLVTSGDVIDVDADQNEEGAVPTSPILTAATALTRAADLISVPWTRNPEAGTWLVDAIDLMGTQPSWQPLLFYIGSSTYTTNPRFIVNRAVNKWTATLVTAAGASASTAAAAAAYGDRVELRPFMTVTGANVTQTLGQSINGAAEAVAAAGTSRALDAAYAGPTRLYIGDHETALFPANLAIRSIAYRQQVRSQEYMRAKVLRGW